MTAREETEGEGLPVLRVSAPNRVDLAGGTLDIFPLYLLVPGTVTVNAAIGVRSLVEVRPVQGLSRLVSGNFPLRLSAPDTHGFSLRSRAGLVALALRGYPPLEGLEIRFRNEAPLGSGIGASSSLLVAVLLAMDALTGRRRGWEEIAREAMEVEAMHLRSLTGRQDHIAALRGGILGIRFPPGRVEADRLVPGSRAGRALESHGVLASTGKAHFSAGVNWRMVRGALEGDAKVLGKFRSIAAIARDAWAALEACDLPAAAEAVAREWAIRKALAPGITTPSVERALSLPEMERRVAGAKLCGAGGGGILFCILRSPADRGPVGRILRRHGFEVLPFRISPGPRILREGEAA